MTIRIFAAFAVLAFLTACSSNPDAPAGGMRTTGTGTSSSTGTAGGDFATGAGDKVFFDPDRAVIRDDGRATLDKQAEWLLRNKTVTVQIAGNCDERGTEEYNLALGSRRANAAQTYLQVRGVAPIRIAAISFGKTRPLAPGSSEDSWAQNRNATTSIR